MKELDKTFISLGEVIKLLGLNKTKETENVFYNSLVNYTDITGDKNDLATISVNNNITTWQKITEALALYITNDEERFDDENVYKNLVKNILSARKQKDKYAENQNMIRLLTVNKYLSTALSAIFSDIDYNNYTQNLKTENFQYKETKKQGFVYIAKQLNETNLYKIGCTNDISKRLGTFKTGNCFVEVIASKYVNDKYYSEKWFHKYYSVKKYQNEWYVLNSVDLAELRDIFNFNFHIC